MHDAIEQSEEASELSRRLLSSDLQDVPVSSDTSPFYHAALAPHDTGVSITIDPVALVTRECITITSAMRKHSRWAQSSVSAILGGGVGKEQDKEISRSSSRNSGAPDRPRTPSIAMPGSVPVNGEGENTLATRWGLRGKKGKSMQDNPLMAAFVQLRSQITVSKDITTFDSPSLLHPFLQVIRSSSTSAPITSLAVVSITKLFSYNVITTKSPRVSLAMQNLSAAITHCRFEGSDSAADEVVLLRILNLMESMLSRAEGQLLGDESVCEMMETGLSMCCQARLSEVLRKSAEMAMVAMCQVIFERLKRLPIEEPLPSSRFEISTARQKGEDVRMEPSVNGETVAATSIADPSTDASSNEARQLKPEASSEAHAVETVAESESQQHAEEVVEVKPYALPSIRELFRVLINLLDPHNRQHSDPMRTMALRIIDVAFEVAGPSIARQPNLARLAKNDLCRYLFQLVRSENVVLLNGSLRVAETLLTTCRKILKLQQEQFLSYIIACLHPRMDIPQEPGIDPTLYEGIPRAPKLVKPPPSQTSSGRSTPVLVKDRQKLGLEGGSRKPETREAMVETLGTLVRIPSFMVELFINYDCEIDRTDLCEDMVGLLSRNALPDSATWSTTNVPPLCLDSLLSFVQIVAQRLDMCATSPNNEGLKQLRARRARKKVIIRGASKFNEQPRSGIVYLVKEGIIDSAEDPVQVARFLKGTTHVSKKVLGDFISKKSSENVLAAFIGLFDFDGKRIDEALRDLLGSFRLPGESALIERILSVFTEKYCSSSVPQGIADKEAAFVLTYGILMLNTDLYNRNVKTQNRMSYVDFAKNLRGVNAGKDFTPEYLQSIYDSIKQNEIIVPDEHDNKHSFEYAWKELLLKSEGAGDLTVCETNAFDADMFGATWKPIVATLCYVFMSATEDAVYSRVIAGLDQYAQIAAKYNLVDAFERIICSLSSISTLAAENPPGTTLNTEVQVGKKSVMVSELAVKFGRDYRAQLATVVLFRILAGNEGIVDESWPQLVRIFMNLFVNSLLALPGPESGGISGLPPIPVQPPSQIINRDGRVNESGIFSTFTSYLSSYAADDPPEPSDEELENTLSTVDCIKSCRLDSIFTGLLALPAAKSKVLVQALLSQITEDTPPLVVVKPESHSPASIQHRGSKPVEAGRAYNPATVYLLEFATILTLRDKGIVAAAGEILTVSLQTIIRDASNLHPVAAQRVVHYLLDLLHCSFVSMTNWKYSDGYNYAN